MTTIFLKTVLLLVTISLTTGCASKSLIVDTHSLSGEAVLFDTIMLDPNHLHGVYIKSIDGLNPYAQQMQFQRFYQDESRNSLAWVLPSGVHKLKLVFQESATLLGRTAKSNTAITLEMAAQGIYVPMTVIAGDEVEWRVIEKRSGSIVMGPWRTPLDRGFAFFTSPYINPAAD